VEGVTINKQPPTVGLIGTTVNASENDSFDAPTCFGWSEFGQVFVVGQDEPSPDGWTDFTEGECLDFVLEESKLTIFSVAKDACFVTDNHSCQFPSTWY
jgi:hypothetical protein